MTGSSRTGTLAIRLSAVIRNYRKSLSLSQEELAERSGVNRTYISDIERGGRNVSIGCVEKIAESFGISASKLIHEAEQAEISE